MTGLVTCGSSRAKWDKGDVCIDGALNPFNIDAKLNGGYVALGLLYGKGDFAKTLEVATRSGQDSDCNPSSAAGILGVMLGYDHIPDVWKAGIPAIADTRFAFTQYSFNQIVASTQARALKVVEGAGGTVSATEIEIPVQEPAAPPLEQWDIGVPLKRVEFTEPAWTFKGRFDEKTVKFSWGRSAQVQGSASGGRRRGDVHIRGTVTLRHRGPLHPGGRPCRRLPRWREGRRNRCLDPQEYKRR